jgi:hypothetical protein
MMINPFISERDIGVPYLLKGHHLVFLWGEVMDMDILDKKERVISDLLSGYKKKSDELSSQINEETKSLRRLQQEAHKEWLENISLDEKKLYDKIYQLNEKLFSDLTFDDLLEEDSEFLRDRIMEPLDRDAFPLYYTRYIIDPELEIPGHYDPRDNTITFHPDHLSDEHIIHEMLHAYEYYYDNQPLLRDFWITRLYSRIHSKIKRLDEYCCQLSLIKGKPLDMYAGKHGVFFLLKSLEIDIRLNFPFGRIFGGNRAW